MEAVLHLQNAVEYIQRQTRIVLSQEFVQIGGDRKKKKKAEAENSDFKKRYTQI